MFFILQGAAAFGLLCARAAVLETGVLAKLLKGRTLVLTEAGAHALRAARQVSTRLVLLYYARAEWK